MPDKLEAARDALAHVVPDGNLAGVLEQASPRGEAAPGDLEQRLPARLHP